MHDTTIHSIRVAPDGRTVEGQIDLGMHGSTRIFFRASDPPLEASASAFLVAALLPCMELGVDCTIDGVVSPRLLRSVEEIQDIFSAWNPDFHRIRIASTSEDSAEIPDGTDPRGIGTFFSGGIDSLYTLRRHSGEIDDLILIHGFDVDLEDHALRKQVSSNLQDLATKTGKRLLEIETNVGVFLRKYVGWAFGHGPALAAVGHLLAPQLRTILIPSTHSHADPVPWGSHPLVDPLWSSERLQFVHDGGELTRVQKTEVVARWPVAMDCLRVCWKNRGGSYNCGRCEKCLRTMVTLQMLGALESAPTFESPLNLRRVASLRLSDNNTRAFANEILADPRLAESEPALRAAVQNWTRPPGRFDRCRQAARRVRFRRFLRRLLAKLSASRRETSARA